MTYPNTKITRKVRLGIMIFLFLIFFITAPILIMYTAGYRYDFKTKKIQQTGVLSVDATPEDMEVFLNNVKILKKMPIRLPNRAPGIYTLKLSKDGYQDWTKDINIESKKTTYIKEITLFKKSLPIKIIENLKKEIVNFYPSYDGQYLSIVTKENNIFEIYLYQGNTQNLSSLSRIKSETNPKINWSPFNNYLIIETNNNPEYTMQILDATNQGTTKTYNFLTPINYQWIKNDYIPSIYIKQSNKIKLVTTNSQEDWQLIDESTDVWYIENENNIWIYNDKILSHGEEQYRIEDGIEKIIDINNDRLIYKNNNEIKVIKITNKKIEQIYTIPTQQIIFNPQTNEWLTWSWWELWTIYNDGNVELLNRTGEKIIHTNPLDQSGVLLLANENKIIGFNPGYYVSHELFNNGTVYNVATDIETRKIYFWGKVGDQTGIFELEY